MRTATSLRACAIAMLLACAIVPAAAAQSGNDLFQQALAKERADGKLQDAIALYQRIVKDYASDRQLVARALVQLGRTQERLGAVEARKSYERVLKEFADQPASVAEARRRIAALDGPAVTQQASTRSDLPAVRQVYRASPPAGAWPSIVGISHDGRFSSYAEFAGPNVGSIVVRDMATGDVRTLATLTGQKLHVAPERTAFSPDGEWLAYSCVVDKSYEIRVINIRTKETRTLLAATAALANARVFDFMPDGRQLLVGTEDQNGRRAMALVSLADNTLRRIMDFADWPARARISPDGKYVIYDAMQDSARKNHDIFIRPLAGGEAKRLVDHPAEDRYALWTPDGHGVFFASDRGGAMAGWFVPVTNGAASGAPIKVLAQVGSAPLGFSADGSLFYSAGVRKSDVQIGEIDVASGKWVKEPVTLNTLAPGENSVPSWSPDGSDIAYSGDLGKSLRVHNLGTGAERQFDVGFDVGRSCWMADGKTIVVASARTPRAGAAYRVDARTGVSAKIADAPTAGWATTVACGRAGEMYYVAGDTLGDLKVARNRIVRRDLASGAERVIFTGTPGQVIPDMAASPDGRSIVFAGSDTSNYWAVVPTDGSGSMRVLMHGVDFRRRISFTPDSKNMLFLQHDVATGMTHELWTVPLDGSAARSAPVKAGTVWDFVLAPDNRHVAVRLDDNTPELWTAERFLPRK